MAEASKTKSKGRKVIITCAVTGSVHTPTMTPYLPITPDEIESPIMPVIIGALPL